MVMSEVRMEEDETKTSEWAADGIITCLEYNPLQYVLTNLLQLLWYYYCGTTTTVVLLLWYYCFGTTVMLRFPSCIYK